MSTGPQPSASYSVTIRVQLPHTAGSFARVAGAIGDTGAILGAIDLVRVEDGRMVRDVTVACADVAHGEAVVAAIEALEGVSVQSVSDRTFLMHRGGKIDRRAEGRDHHPRRPLDGLHAGRGARLQPPSTTTPPRRGR